MSESTQQLRSLAADAEQAKQAVVDEARRLNAAGVTWAVIGQALGVTRQAAWERFHQGGAR